MLLRAALLLFLSCPAFAWGPQAHGYLGRSGAGDAGFGARDAEAAGAGAFVADIDHTLKVPGVVGDSVAFARALVAVQGRSAVSDRWAAGWLAHALAQDPGQGEISDSRLKQYADFILNRTRGQQIGGAVYDPERIRLAAIALGGKPPTAEEIRKAVEEFVLLGVLQGAVNEVIPLDLDERSNAWCDEVKERVPDFDFIPRQLREPGTGLPPARKLMPRQLSGFDRFLAGSLEATGRVLRSAPPAGLGETVKTQARANGRVPLPPPRAIGLTFQTRAATDGMMRTTVSLTGMLLFRPALLGMLEKIGKDLFPSAVLKWDAMSRIGNGSRAVQQYLRETGARLRELFPDRPASR